MQIDLIHEDCLTALGKLKPNSIDVVITSPPYNLGVKYDNYFDKQHHAAYLRFLRRLAKQIRRVLKDDGSLFLNIAGSNKKALLPFQVTLLYARYFILQNNIIWIKSLAVDGITRGHYKPIPGPRFLNHTHENLLHFTKHGKVVLDRLAVGVPFSDKTNIKRRQHAQDLKCAGNVWTIFYTTRNEKSFHPAQFPVELPLRCLKLHGKKNPVVCDPCMGAGTTGVAAKQYKARKFIGMELSKQYIKIGQQRITRE